MKNIFQKSILHKRMYREEGVVYAVERFPLLQERRIRKPKIFAQNKKSFCVLDSVLKAFTLILPTNMLFLIFILITVEI